MSFDLRLAADKNRNRIAVLAFAGWALVASACTGDDSATGNAGGNGAGAAGSAADGAAGSRSDGAPGGSTGAGAAGSRAEAGLSDAASLSCIPDGGTDSGDCCPDDPEKTEPGQCGCGMMDFDYDKDGLADCVDPCPLTLKLGPGVCGCDVPDTDTDGDGALDCKDECPGNPARSTAGLCGCALPDSAAPSCLAHRYSFNDRPAGDAGAAAGDAGAGDASGGEGGAVVAGTTMVTDSVGTAHGTAVNVVLTGTGTLTLAGEQSDQYVSLPSGIISALGDSATFEGWVSWTSAGAWQRVFDFGVADPTMPGVQGTGTAFVFLTPLRGVAPDAGAGSALFTVNTVGLTEAIAPAAFPQGTPGAAPHHFAAVVDRTAGEADASGGTARLYVDGALVASTPLGSTLSGLRDVNNWLGRSQFAPDPEFGGTYYEFRIHSSAMTQAQINASIAAGPDALP
jgi:hypothetical protein